MRSSQGLALQILDILKITQLYLLNKGSLAAAYPLDLSGIEEFRHKMCGTSSKLISVNWQSDTIKPPCGSPMRHYQTGE